MLDPTVDILMATYNGERYIAEQIESLQHQTYRNWQLLISDDCSTDQTLDIARRYASQDSRIHIVSEGVRYGSAKENFFSLIEQATSAYAMFCDQDDVWLPNKVSETLNAEIVLENGNYEKPFMTFTDMKIVDRNLRVIAQSFEADSNINPYRQSFRQVIAQSVGAGCTMMVNGKLLELMRIPSDHSRIIMHDHWATIIAAAFGGISFIPEQTSLYRQHGDNSIGADRFSVVDRARNVDRMQDRYIGNVNQAATFLDTYGSMLSKDQRSAIELYVDTIFKGPIYSIVNLIRSGCWKKGSRKIGQIICALTINRGRKDK
jgi:glycosyltransferase involved in cell wall biosynthesis